VNSQSKAQAVEAAMSIANDVTEGRLDPADLDRLAAQELRALFAKVSGPNKDSHGA
jgi:hypothetical protein